MFLGQYRHSLDEKGRLTIPARFREELTDGAYLIQGFDRNLRLLPEKDFLALYEKINGMNMADPAVRQLRRLVFANATKVDFDRLGRVLVPQFLREVARLAGESVIVGVGKEIEIWAPDAWAEPESQLQDAGSNAMQFATLDLSM
jgi:MraZ protein